TFALSAPSLSTDRALHSFPTRRSSDLEPLQCLDQPAGPRRRGDLGGGEMPDRRAAELPVQPEQRHQVDRGQGVGADGVDVAQVRSEEHTSELQSRENLVCRLLLEKKKN